MVIAMTCCMCYTSCLFIMFALFGADDRGEWARGRLELLPVERTDVVKARYGIMALAIATTMAAGFVASLVLALAVSLVNGTDEDYRDEKTANLMNLLERMRDKSA